MLTVTLLIVKCQKRESPSHLRGISVTSGSGLAESAETAERGGLFIPSLCLVMHVLCVAGIDHGDGLAVEGVGIVPLVGMGHVVALLFPAAQGWLAA